MSRTIAIALIFLLAGCAPINPKTCFGDACVSVELASTPEQHARGLMWRESMDKDNGMLFIFPADDLHSFWMKNTLLPLDIIWLDAKGEVIHITTAQPCEADPCPSFGPKVPSRYVLETNAGWTGAHGVHVGSTAILPLQSP